MRTFEWYDSSAELAGLKRLVELLYDSLRPSLAGRICRIFVGLCMMLLCEYWFQLMSSSQTRMDFDFAMEGSYFVSLHRLLF